jgi:hypothetical protein
MREGAGAPAPGDLTHGARLHRAARVRAAGFSDFFLLPAAALCPGLRLRAFSTHPPPAMNTFEHQLHASQDDDLPMASKAIFGAAFGKLDDKIDETRMDGATMERLRATAVEMGMQMPDFVRLCLRVAVWGEDHMASIAVQQIRRVTGRAGNVSGPGGTAR